MYKNEFVRLLIQNKIMCSAVNLFMELLRKEYRRLKKAELQNRETGVEAPRSFCKQGRNFATHSHNVCRT